MKDIAIIHYNTPELTEAAILSLRKQCKDDYCVTVFDNSDRRPFKKRMRGVKRIDNTKGQVIDFDKFLAEYPDRESKYAIKSKFGSAKHIRTVQELWDILPDGFILMESDIIIKRDIGFIWQPEYAAVGRFQWHQPGNLHHIPRLLPILCYLNVPLLVANGARYFDPNRCWALQKGITTKGNWYDTGASLFEDIRKTKPQLVARNIPAIYDYIDHYGGGSWKHDDVESQKRWLKEREMFWKR
jgi:hypothetical protein